jgi:3-oxoacyl-[acyl-carrier protein] reductase
VSLPDRPVALVTGASRRTGLGAATALALARSGWDVAITYWSPYDAGQHWSADHGGPEAILSTLSELGTRSFAIEADLAEPDTPARVFGAVEDALGSVSGLVLNHCECQPTTLAEVSTDVFVRHFQVNVLANVGLIKEFAHRFPTGALGRIVSITSDHTMGNVPYGVTKAAADRVTLAAAFELASLGVTANAINPGPTDTGWMTDENRVQAARATPLPRHGQPKDVANLVSFLFSEDGGWVTAQLLYSNGGFRSTIG